MSSLATSQTPYKAISGKRTLQRLRRQAGFRSAKDFAEALGIPEEMIRLLNPQYKQGIIPATIKPYPLVLPQREISRFIDCQSALFARNDDSDEERLNGQKQAEYGQTGEDYKPKEPVGTKYKVKKGDTLGAIAKRYGTTVKGIMRRNNLPDTRLRIGQILYIGK